MLGETSIIVWTCPRTFATNLLPNMGRDLGKQGRGAIVLMRAIHRLSAVKVTSLKQPGYYADGGSLYLRVAAGGSKGWIFRFTIVGRTRDAGLGAFPTVSLIKAREQAAECRRLVAAGADPIEARKNEREAARIAADKAMTFEQCAKAFIDEPRNGLAQQRPPTAMAQQPRRPCLSCHRRAARADRRYHLGPEGA